MPKVSDDHRAAKRRQVLDAATACFAREGFHRTTMQDIVGEAGLSAGAVYGYFASKDEIIQAIAAERHEHEQDVIRSLAGRPAAEILRALAREFLGGLTDSDERRRRRLGVQIWSEALRQPDVLKLVRHGIDEPLGLLAEVVAEMQGRAEIPASLSPEAAARVMLALFHGFILQQSWDPSVEVEPYLAVIEAAIDALVAAPARPGPRSGQS